MVNMGRKPTAEINFPEDHHLSNIHSKLCLIDGRVYLEDMGSTNGYALNIHNLDHGFVCPRRVFSQTTTYWNQMPSSRLAPHPPTHAKNSNKCYKREHRIIAASFVARMTETLSICLVNIILLAWSAVRVLKIVLFVGPK